MSYTISMRTPPCEHCGSEGQTVFSCDPTYNYAKAIYLAFERAAPDVELPPSGNRWCGWLSGKQGHAASDAINRVAKWLSSEEHASELDALMPDNGWGTLSGLRHVFRDIADACDAHPKARFFAC